jgi:hypothetical protein
MITNDQGILICENCGLKIRTGLTGDRICPALEQVGHCPDLNLTYSKPEKDLNLTYSKPEKSKFTRTGKETKNYGT